MDMASTFLPSPPSCARSVPSLKLSSRDLIERGVSGAPEESTSSPLTDSSLITLRLFFLPTLSERSERVDGMLSMLVLVSMTAEFGRELLVPLPESVR